MPDNIQLRGKTEKHGVRLPFDPSRRIFPMMVDKSTARRSWRAAQGTTGELNLWGAYGSKVFKGIYTLGNVKGKRVSVPPDGMQRHRL